MCVHIYIYIYICVSIYIYGHIYIYMYMWGNKWNIIMAHVCRTDGMDTCNTECMEGTWGYQPSGS